MEVFAHSSFGVFLTSLFATYFTAPSRQSLMVLAYLSACNAQADGWSLATTQHTIASYKCLDKIKFILFSAMLRS